MEKIPSNLILENTYKWGIEMGEEALEKRWLMVGIIISLVVGLVLGSFTDKPYLVIAAGMIAAYAVQRLTRKSDKLVESENGKTESD